jgi:hypothetical protein
MDGRCSQRLSCRLVRVLQIAPVVQQAQLVAHVDQRDAAAGQHQAVQQQDAADRQVDLGLVTGRQRLFQAGQGGGRAADAGIPGARVALEQGPAGEGAGKASGVEVVEEAPVGLGVLADRAEVVVAHGPADVVVIAQVIDRCGAEQQPRCLCMSLVVNVALRVASPLQRWTMNWLL